MSDLRELYQAVIIDHGRHPRNFKKRVDANHKKEGFNPLCGDRLTVYLQIDQGRIVDACFEGSGCAISLASASLMTETLKGKTVMQVRALFDDFHQAVMGKTDAESSARLGKLTVLQGVSAFPARVKCATLAWHTAMAAMDNQSGSVSTE